MKCTKDDVQIFFTGKEKSQLEVMTLVIAKGRGSFLQIKKKTGHVLDFDVGRRADASATILLKRGFPDGHLEKDPYQKRKER